MAYEPNAGILSSKKEEEERTLSQREAEGSALLSKNTAVRGRSPKTPSDSGIGSSGILGPSGKSGILGPSGGSGIGVPPVRKTVDMYKVVSHLSKPEEDSIGVKTLDFLFGPEAAVIGIAHDSKGWSWSVDNAKQQWSEQPVWINALATTSLVGTIMLPAALAVKSTFKVGRMATKLKVGTALEKAEIGTWKDMGILKDQRINKYADLDEDTVIMLRKQEVAVNRYQKMKARAERAATDEPLNAWERVQHEFDRRFAQTYNALIDDAANGGIKSEFHEMHDKLWQNDTIGTILREMPTEADSPAIYAYLLGRITPGKGLSAAATKQYGKLSVKNQKWADFYYEAAKRRQSEMVKTGFISEETFKNVGPAHLPATYKDTPGLGDISPVTTHIVPIKPKPGKKRATGIIEEEGKIKAVGEYQQVAITTRNEPKLSSPTLKHRTGTPEDIFERLQSGDMVTDMADVTINGYMTDGILHSNFQFITDMITKPNSTLFQPSDLAKASGFGTRKMKKLGYMSLENAPDGASAILRRMIAKKTGKAEEALPWVKTDVFNEIWGERGMMAQTQQISHSLMDVMTTIYKTMKTAGSIPTHIQNLSGNMSFLAQAGFNIASPENVALMGRMTTAFNKIAEINKVASEAGMTTRGKLFDSEGLLKGIDLGTEAGFKGSRLNLADEFFDPTVQELLEASAFEQIEGSRALERMGKALSDKQIFTKGVISAYTKSKDIAQVGNRVKWFDQLTKAYLAEDMVPKMAYFVHLRGKGLSRQSAVTEVARRLPMYGTVGSAIKRGRKFAFPWATFPAEALRITKNNLQDHPLRMIPWLRAPQVMQSMLSGMGFAGDPTEVRESKRQLPFWAQAHTTLLGEGRAIAAVGGGGTGALFGTAAGAILGKSAKAAYAGGLAGGAFGGFLAAMNTDEAHAKQMRGAMLDFLPHSTFLMTTNAPDFGGNYAPWQDLPGLLEQMPAEPLAILKPMISAFTGETPYGEPAGDGTIGGGISKTIAGMLGFLAPPILQKYGLKMSTPDVPLWGDPTGVTNISRFLIDTGNAIDPMTGRPGSMTNDFWINNFGVFKSYAATGEQQLANESKTEQHMYKIRKHLAKNLDYHLNKGNEREIVQILTEIQGSFAEQFQHSPLVAQEKYTRYLKGISDRLGQHPKLRQWSQADIEDRLEQAGQWAGEARNRAREELLEALRKEYLLKGRNR
ncbi:hypothetical protein LCGC14_0208710 [marine sediment metagenome]|uniref:Large polyvalent protein associated domain-containing protein n=1 Tax=marine sediment metagenome TaxID=412755 RepID=A0A0F9UGN8_9ZZZZ